MVAIRDLARFYHTETRRINEAVNKSKTKFPERFCFRITESEYNFLKSQIVTSKGGSRKGHTVFTEQVVVMLAIILKTDVATKVSIVIMAAFVAMRKYISSNLLEQKYINNMVLNHNSQIKLLHSKAVYHCGASINRIGYKTFSITLIGDEEVSCLLINRVNKII